MGESPLFMQEEALASPLFTVKGLKKYFPLYAGIFRKEVGEVKAVDGIDFTLSKGKILGLLGESGSGKSTAARASVRLIEPTEGEIFFEGMPLLGLSKKALKKIRKEIQFIFQDPYASLNPRKTIEANMGDALLYHEIAKTAEEAREMSSIALEKIGLSKDALRSYPHQFSGGQQQRICIGRAIALRPKLIICDEAVSALDVSLQAQIINLLLELKDNFHFSYLFISHNMDLIRYLSDSVAIFHRGKIVEQGKTEEVLENPAHPYTQQLLASTLAFH